jgi:hypothetical protein
MIFAKAHKYWGGLQIGPYKADNIYPLIPLLKQEFPNWSSEHIKSYIELIISKKDHVSGLWVAKNEAHYYVGLIIYTIQQLSSKHVYKLKGKNGKSRKKTFLDVLVVENLIASSPILQKQIFMTLVDAVVDIAKNKSCNFVELSSIESESFDLIKDKYQHQITEAKGLRSYLKLSESTTANMET